MLLCVHGKSDGFCDYMRNIEKQTCHCEIVFIFFFYVLQEIFEDFFIFIFNEEIIVKNNS